MAISEPAAEADVLCVGLLHVYGSTEEPVVALRNVDLEVARGEMVALVGPSGSGKSTLLAVLSGLLRPTGGRIMVAGRDLTRLDERALRRLRGSDLALLLQDPLHNLLPYASARENLSFARVGAGKSRGGLDRRELEDVFALREIAAVPVHRLSGGEQQRVALASAFATGPRILLADEPTGQLDGESRDALMVALRRANEMTGSTVVVVTHDLSVAEGFPRTVAISHGMIGAEGRGRHRFAVLGRDGTVQLPAEVTERYPPGTLFEVTSGPEQVELRPAAEDSDGR